MTLKLVESNRVKSGKNLEVGSWYRIVELDPGDPNPSLRVGHVLECKPKAAGCIDPENVLKDGMGTEWFADFGPAADAEPGDEDAFRTLVTKVEFVRGAAS